MKNYVLLILINFVTLGFSQVTADLTEVIAPKDSVVSVDSFDYYYYLNNKSLKKQNQLATFNYSNLSLGPVENINTFNPLKTFIFYKDSNALVVLDNRLSELSVTNFNTLPDFKMVTQITPTQKNFVWLFNQITLKLEQFNYLTKETTLSTNPITSKILDITSDYNYIWLLTEDKLTCYNYRGIVEYSFENKGFEEIESLNEHLILKKKQSLIFYHKITKVFDPIKLKHQLINSFFVSQQNLYIYELNKIYKYKLNF
jgi:hypothetical protein